MEPVLDSESGSVSPFDRDASPRSSTITALPEHVDAGLIRGARTSVLFSGFGRIFQTSSGDDSTYECSQQVQEIDEFISHDWNTARWKKLLSLCFLMNSVPAFFASCAVAVITGILESPWMQVLPLSFTTTERLGEEGISYPCGWWAMVLPILTHLVVFFYWQSIRELFCLKPRYVFLDKACIHQTDEKLKGAAVSGLAGILKQSKRLVVLWSPTYLTRLWCTYEVASWIHLGKMHQDSVVLMPSDFSIGLLLFQLCTLLGQILGLLVWDPLGDIFEIFAFMAMVLTARSFALLQRQLESFDIGETACFCCSVDHKDPATGANLPCDREAVYITLKGWFRDTGSGTGTMSVASVISKSHIMRFNGQIRSSWGKEVMESLSNGGLLYQMGLGAASPIIWDVCSRLHCFDKLDINEGLLHVSAHVLKAVVLLPALLCGSVWMSLRVRIMQLPPRWQTWSQTIRTLLQIMVVLVAAAVLEAHQEIQYRISFAPGAILFQVLIVLLAVVLVGSFYFRRRCSATATVEGTELYGLDSGCSVEDAVISI